MWTCPNCERPLLSKNQWHNCVKNDIDSLFEDKPAVIMLIFEQVYTIVTEWENVRASATKNCVVFIAKKSFLIIRPKKKHLEIKFYLPYYTEDFPVVKSSDLGGKYETLIRIADISELSQSCFRMFRESYEL